MLSTVPSDLELLRRFEPILRFNEGELFLPVSVDDYVRCCGLGERSTDGRSRTVLAERGTLTLDLLAEHGRAHARPGQYLRLVDTSFGPLQSFRWRRRSDRPRFHGASRLARVGVLSRGIDALSRASLMVRGKNSSGTEAAAETAYRTLMRADHHPYYGRVVHDSGYTVLQYWYFYAFNDWRSRVFGVNDHEADWEQVTLYLVDHDLGGDGSGGDFRPQWVASSAHDEVGDDLRRRWDDPDLTIEGDHLVIYPGLGSHSGAYLAGEYLTTHDGAAFAGLLRITRRVSRTLLPWTRDAAHAGLSIPYIDYSRGDGVTIGPGQNREWCPEVIDDTTPWVVHYRGLWGNDTQDPFGGERGPAGPRNERSAAVRLSWGDPVGWAGLRKVPATRAGAEVAVAARLDELDAEINELDREIDAAQLRLRALVASDEVVPPAASDALAVLASDRVARGDERLVLRQVGERPEVAQDAHAHLRHRRMPLPTETKSRRRLLALWSAISTSVVLAIPAVMLVRPAGSVALVGIETVVVLFAIEALARKRLVQFAALLLAGAVAGLLALAFATALIRDWRIAVAIPLGVASLALLFLNVRELLRD